MMNIKEKKLKSLLLVVSSPRGEQSYSTQVASNLVAQLKQRQPELEVVVRNVAQSPIPHIGTDFVEGLHLSNDQRTPAQAQAFALSDKLTNELLSADTLVIAAPMYNFGLPSTLKSWLDHIFRAGLTFSYTEQGPVGLAKGKKAILVISRGGVYSEGPAKPLDFQEGYLRCLLNFIGITDVQVIRVEGVGLGKEATEKALAEANLQANAAIQHLCE